MNINWLDLFRLVLFGLGLLAERTKYTGDEKMVSEAKAALEHAQNAYKMAKTVEAWESTEVKMEWPEQKP